MKDKIKTFEDACKVLGIEPTVPEFSGVEESERKALIAHYKLTVIARALNNGWKPNWNDWNQWKYYPWFRMGDNGGSPGVGSSFYGFGRDYARSAVGSRLCFESEELANYAGQQFEELYKDYFLIQ